MRAPLLLALVLATPSAAASMDETLDVSAHVTHASLTVNDHSVETTGVSLRLGQTQHELRYGIGLGAALPPIHASWLTGEAFLGYAPNGYWALRPFIEVRAHVDRLQLGEASLTRGGVGPRFGVLIPLSEYFFVDAGIGRDLIGSDELRGTIGIGLPIPLSHL